MEIGRLAHRIFVVAGPVSHPLNMVGAMAAYVPLAWIHAARPRRRPGFHQAHVQASLELVRPEPAVPVNLGNPNEFTILDLANQVIELTGSRSRVMHHPLPQDDPRQRCPDISIAKNLLDWAPKIQLTEGLTRTIEYFDSVLRSQRVQDVVADPIHL